MEIIISDIQDGSNVSMMKVRGALDSNSYQSFISEAEKIVLPSRKVGRPYVSWAMTVTAASRNTSN